MAALRQVLGPDRSADRVSAALTALQRAGASAGPALPELQALLQAREPGLARQAAEAIGSTGTAGLPILIEALRGEGASRRLGLQGLPLVGGAAVPKLRELLQDRRESVRNASIQALGMLGARAAETTPDLVDLYRQGRAAPVLILGTLSAIGSRASPEAGQLAVEALNHPAIEVRQAAAEAIPHLGELALNPLVTLAVGRDTPLRRRAVDLLPAMAPYCLGILPIIASLAKDTELPVRRAAIRTLGAIGPPAADQVGLLCEALNDGDSDLRLAAADALGALGPAAREQALPCLEALLQTRPEVILRDHLEQARRRLTAAPAPPVIP